MWKNIILSILLIIGTSLLVKAPAEDVIKSTQMSGAPPNGVSENEVPNFDSWLFTKDWKRPDAPPKVGIQIGHYKNNEVPDELINLKNNTGAHGGGKWEWEVNYEIATLIAKNLNEKGIETDILPATIPPNYWADVFIAIHADGNEDRNKSGYKFAGPWRDYTQKSGKLVSILEKTYEEATGLPKDEEVTKNMRGYYAFSWWKYEHSIHPMTTAVIAETGFLTNWRDQKLLIKTPEIPAKAISDGIIEYLQSDGLF